MRTHKIFLIWAVIFWSLSLQAKTISLDDDEISINLTNNTMNLLVFPFIVADATISTRYQKHFDVVTKNTSVIILPSAKKPSEVADLAVWSENGDAFLIKLQVTGSTRKFTFSTNKVTSSTANPRAKQFESNRIEKDIKRLIKYAAQGKEIPGYKEVKIKKQFKTPQLLLQKDKISNGGKYRVEYWFIKNRTNRTLVLDYGSFYTKGIINITFRQKTLLPGQVTKAWFVIDKASLTEN